jgi:hypothetical protein
MQFCIVSFLTSKKIHRFGSNTTRSETPDLKPIDFNYNDEEEGVDIDSENLEDADTVASKVTRSSKIDDLDINPELFNPDKLNCEEWVKFSKSVGFKFILFTVMHQDGFALWPTKTKSPSVATIKWEDGKRKMLFTFHSFVSYSSF